GHVAGRRAEILGDLLVAIVGAVGGCRRRDDLLELRMRRQTAHQPRDPLLGGQMAEKAVARRDLGLKRRAERAVVKRPGRPAMSFEVVEKFVAQDAAKEYGQLTLARLPAQRVGGI